jgi:hypothetical protein
MSGLRRVDLDIGFNTRWFLGVHDTAPLEDGITT